MGRPEEVAIEEKIASYSTMLSDEKGNGERSHDAKIRQQFLHGKLEGLREALEIVKRGATP